MSTTPVKIALRRFVAEIGGERLVIEEGERVVDGHDVVRRHPENFRSRGLEEELQIRAECVASMRSAEQRERVTKAPLSEAGRRDRDEANFWDRVTHDLERTAPGRPSSAERTEQAFFDTAIAQFEEGDTRQLAEVNDAAARAFNFDGGGWSRRSAD